MQTRTHSSITGFSKQLAISVSGLASFFFFSILTLSNNNTTAKTKILFQVFLLHFTLHWLQKICIPFISLDFNLFHECFFLRQSQCQMSLYIFSVYMFELHNKGCFLQTEQKMLYGVLFLYVNCLDKNCELIVGFFLNGSLIEL